MIKRILYILFIVILLAVLGYFYMQLNEHSEQVDKTDLVEIIPNNAGIIVEIPHLNDLATNDKLESEMWSSLLNLSDIEEYATKWNKWNTLALANPELRNWANCPAIITYHQVGKRATPFFAMKISNKAIEKAWKHILENQSPNEEKTYNGVKIFQLETGITHYYYFDNSYFVTSSSQILLEQSIRNMHGDSELEEDFTSLRKTKGNGVNLNIFVNYKRLQAMLGTHTLPKSLINSRLLHIGDWGEYDFSADKSNIILNGFSTYQSDEYWQIFANQESVKSSIQEAIPSASEGFMTLSIEDFKQFRADYESYLQHLGSYAVYQEWINLTKKRGADNLQLLFDNMIQNEIVLRHDDKLTSQKDESLVILRTHSASSAKEALMTTLSAYAKNKGRSINDLRSEVEIDSQSSFDLYNFPFDNCFKFMYGEAFTDFNAKYFCFHDNYIIFGADRGVIKKALIANMLKQTYANDETFIELYNSFSAKNSIFYFSKTQNLIPTIESNTSVDFCQKAGVSMDNLSNFYGLAYQMVASGKYVYNTILFNYNADLKDKPLTQWNSQLEAAPISKPTFVKNHITNENEICVQDELNNLYLISKAGLVIWKKPIGERILSDIKQVDYYKNNKLQLLFNTASKLWILDRNGNFIERYPILLPSNATTGLSLFDYDKSRNYRIFIPTEDKHIYLFNKEGNINTNFKFGTTEYPLTMPIQHFRVQGKDYLILADKHRVYILNRKGESRIKLKEQFSASPNNIFYLGTDTHNHLATTDIEGNVMKIYLDGSVKKVELTSAGEQHYFAQKDLIKKGEENFIIVDGEIVNVYDTKGNIVYSKKFENAQLSQPYIYSFASNVTKIGLVDKQQNSIYLLNGNDGKLYNGFPLIGSTPFSIGFLSTSAWRFNLIVGGDNGTLYNYKVK